VCLRSFRGKNLNWIGVDNQSKTSPKNRRIYPTVFYTGKSEKLESVEDKGFYLAAQLVEPAGLLDNRLIEIIQRKTRKKKNKQPKAEFIHAKISRTTKMGTEDKKEVDHLAVILGYLPTGKEKYTKEDFRPRNFPFVMLEMTYNLL
jgi:hypothetical protein